MATVYWEGLWQDFGWKELNVYEGLHRNAPGFGFSLTYLFAVGCTVSASAIGCSPVNTIYGCIDKLLFV
jgi:hypothetical protein